MTLVRNAASNVGERVITAALTIVTVPIQVRLLGLEAYGLLGFVASLQLLFGVLDFGLGPTIIREIAADSAGSGTHSRALAQTFAAVYWTLALVAGGLLAAAAPWIATHWLHVETLPIPTVVLAVRLIAISVLLRWPVALYAGAIAGAQRLDVVNVIRIAMSCLKLLAGLLVLLWFRTVSSYLIWLAFAAIVEVLCYMVGAVRYVPNFSLRPAVSMPALRRVWRFSLHMNLISVLAAMFVQADRLVIGRMLAITELGLYSVAYNLAVGVSMLQNVVSTALFPAFAQEVEGRSPSEITHWCAVATEVVTYLACGAGAALIFYGDAILTLWISADSATRASGTTAILTVGFVASAAVSVPYTLAIAAGETGVALAANLVAGVFYVPALYWLVRHHGINGAAWVWVGLNVYYLVVLLPMLHRRLKMESVPRWFVRHVLPFAGSAVLAVGGSRWMAAHASVRRPWPLVGTLAIGGILYAAGAFRLLDPSVSAYLKAAIARLRARGQGLA